MTQQVTKSWFYDQHVFKGSEQKLGGVGWPIIEPVQQQEWVTNPYFHKRPVDPYNRAFVVGGKPQSKKRVGLYTSTRLQGLYDYYVPTMQFSQARIH